MAAEHGKWETVVSKKKGPVSKTDVRKAKQSFIDNSSSHKAEFKNPLEEAETIYAAAFTSKDLKEKDAGDKYPSFHQVDGQKKGTKAQLSSPKKQKKSVQKAQKPSPLDGIEEKIAKLSVEELSILIKDVQDKFPSHSLIWLKEVCCWLQKKFQGPAEKNLMLSNHPKGFPANLLQPDVKKEIQELLKQSNEQSLEMLFCYCITALLDELQQGKLTIGLRILLQLVISHIPKVLITKLDEVLNGKSSSQESFLAVIWTYNQYNNDIKAGIKAWWKVMYPVMRVGTHAPHVVQYIEDLLSKHSKMKFSDSAIDAKKFYEVLSTTFSPKSQLANLPSLKRRFDDLYPLFKRLYFSDKIENMNKDKFSKLQLMLNSADEGVQSEVLRLLVLCLARDTACFDSWLGNLEKNLKSSGILWDYMHSNYKDVCKEILSLKKYKSKNIVQEKAEEFLIELRHIKRKGNGSKVGFAECYAACQKFEHKEPIEQGGHFSIRKLLKHMMIIMIMLVTVDIFQTRGYKGSRTESIAVNLGIDHRLGATLVQLEGMAGCAGRWSKENLPHYYAKVAPYLDPVMDTTWKYTALVSEKVYECTKPVITFLSKNTEELFKKIDEFLPGYTSKVTENASKLWSITVVTTQHYMNNTMSVISKNAPIIANHVTTAMNSTGIWIYELHPPFFDSVTMHAHCSFNCTKRYVNDAWQVIVEYTPIIMEKTVEYVRIVTIMLQGYCSAGQIWIQNMLRSTAGGSNAGTSK